MVDCQLTLIHLECSDGLCRFSVVAICKIYEMYIIQGRPMRIKSLYSKQINWDVFRPIKYTLKMGIMVHSVPVKRCISPLFGRQTKARFIFLQFRISKLSLKCFIYECHQGLALAWCLILLSYQEWPAKVKQCIDLRVRIRACVALVMSPRSHSMTRRVAKWTWVLVHHQHEH